MGNKDYDQTKEVKESKNDITFSDKKEKVEESKTDEGKNIKEDSDYDKTEEVVVTTKEDNTTKRDANHKEVEDSIKEKSAPEDKILPRKSERLRKKTNDKFAEDNNSEEVEDTTMEETAEDINPDKD